MATKSTSKKTSNGALAAEVGAGLAAAAAAASAGYYFYASKDAKKNRKIAAKWAGNLQKDVVKEAKRMGKQVDAKSVAQAVDTAIAAYQTMNSIDRADLKRAAAELKHNWQMIQKEARSAARKGAARGKSAAKKASKSAKKSIAKGRAAMKNAAKRTAKKAAKKRR